MKVGELKTEALKLMFATQGDDPALADLSELSGGESYGSYLNAMTGSINRCLADLENKGIAWPSKTYELSAEDAERGEVRLGEKIADFLSMERISCWRDDGLLSPSVPYRLVGDCLYIRPFDRKRAHYTVFYRPTLPRLTKETDPETEIPLPERIAAWIPYWIVGELFLEDEPDLGTLMMNRYHAAVQDLRIPLDGIQRSVCSTYSMTEGSIWQR